MKNLKKLIAIICVCAICISFGTISTFAVENIPSSEYYFSDVKNTRSATNNFIYPDDNSVYISGSPTRVTYTAQMTGIFAKKGNIVLSFVGQNTGERHSMVFECDGQTHSDGIGFTFTTDTYHISAVMVDANVNSIIVNLHN